MFPCYLKTPAPKRGEIVRQIGQALRDNLENLGKLVSYNITCSINCVLPTSKSVINVTVPLFKLRLVKSVMQSGKVMTTNKQTTIWRNFWGHSPVAGLTRLHARCTKPKASLIPPLTWE